MNLTITSDAFDHQGEIPSIYTCEGSDISPSLAWAGAPEGTRPGSAEPTQAQEPTTAPEGSAP